MSIFGLFQLPHFRRQMSSSADRGDGATGSATGSPKARGTPTGIQPAGPLSLTSKSRAVSTQEIVPQPDGAIKVRHCTALYSLHNATLICIQLICKLGVSCDSCHQQLGNVT